MAKFQGAVLNCKICGTAFKVPPRRIATAEYCSTPCSAKGRAEKRKKRVNLTCERCGKSFESVSCHAERRRYCSPECKHSAPDYLSALAWRNRGSANGNWKGGTVRHSDGYLYAYAPYHPFASNGYVFAHRLIMESWLRETDPNSIYLMRLGEHLYLSPDFVVHHKDENKRNNAVSNLECMTPADHRRHHNQVNGAG